MLTLNNLKSPKGSNRKTKRIGRGQGSGQGTQAGKGHKGQKARSGGGVRSGFEGGAMPLYMRLPKKGFSNAAFRNDFAIVSLDQIEQKFAADEEVSKEALIAKGMIKGSNRQLPVKVLAGETLSKSLTFKGISKFSGKAEELIKGKGGSIN